MNEKVGLETRVRTVERVSALLTAELGRHHSTAVRGLESLDAMIASLEQACRTSLRQFVESTGPSVLDADFIQKLVAAAVADIEEDALRRSSDAQTEIDRLRAQISALEDGRQTVAVELALAREEAALLRGQLSTEESKVARLKAAIETVQRAVHLAESVDRETGDAIAKPVNDATRDAPSREHVPVKTVSESAPPPTPAPRAESRTSSTDRPAAAAADSDGGLAELARSLAVEIERAYHEDVAEGLNPTELVARLAENLRIARETFASQLGASDTDAARLIDQQLTELLDGKSNTELGRRLAIAAYDYVSRAQPI
jgi:hypothetical protein